ncbi:hypothetical protein LR48_Vigan09g248900 [Vigna angularis]|uniref:Bromo domain-containing protein n=3 Tax=Phaseolus angularis TaxID=3914 RepID=A0A0L9VFJ4_PHAAN|nr:uncharacterized protein LOC108341131 isoform X1 [Vigna angularis]KOM53830.1 hypothetical protein LR48_Vigan09g248900 [Vigna angularis]BAT87032.1 hypothetical protein VIGAN_05037000 [Vigna angularis var. angularis]
MGAETLKGWGTWEELLLGGAILRHGTKDWNVVATELRARTGFPYTITPQVCKAKYEDLLQRYSGNKAWYEELRKTRVAELKRSLEISEDSIGSLESKLERLKGGKNEKRDGCDVDNGSGRPKLHVASHKLERVESSTKDTSKDGLSAGSFTHETLPSVPVEHFETKPDKLLNVDKLAYTVYQGEGGTFKKRRGKRKRKYCGKNTKEPSMAESVLLDSVDVMSWCKENSTSYYSEVAKSSDVNYQNRNLKKSRVEDMVKILDSIFETKCASAFRRRLDSQKRGRYKKMIRQHMDFDTIRSRISNQTIRSCVELFRDLLLLTNNALVFYSKNTREYKSAVLLRDIVTKKIKESLKDSSNKVTNTQVTNAPMNNPHVKPKNIRCGTRKTVAKTGGGNISVSGVSHGTKKHSKVDSPSSVESLSVKKRGFGRPKKVGRGSASQKPAVPMKGKKKVRSK